MNLKLVAFLLILCITIPAFAQAPAPLALVLPNIAVIPIAGDNNVTPQQLNFLTGKFAGELITTNTFRVLDRGKMDYILKEQGFQQGGACNSSECQVQMGQLLGVDNIVAGNLVRFGQKYALRADYIDVGSGQVLFAAEVSESGELEDVYELLCQGAATKLAQKFRSTQGRTDSLPPVVSVAPTAPPPVVTPPVVAHPPVAPAVTPSVNLPAPVVVRSSLSFKRKMALALWGYSLLGAGGGYFMDTKIKGYATDYETAYKTSDIAGGRIAYDNIQKFEMGRNAGYGVSIGTFLVGAVLWFLPEGK